MRELLFRVTAADCRFDYYRGSGKGGQKRNKTSSAVRCTHLASGAVGQSDDTRSQHRNRQIAFRRMSETDVFASWHRTECARRMGRLKQVDEAVTATMASKNLRVEIRNESCRWREWINED